MNTLAPSSSLLAIGPAAVRRRIWRWVFLTVLLAMLLGAVLFVLYPKKGWSGVIMVVEEVSERIERPCPTHEASSLEPPVSLQRASWPPPVIAHAGGGINGLTYTNSREAMDLSLSQGCTTIEIDLELTSDERLVLLHDWGGSAGRIFGSAFLGERVSSSAFLAAPRQDLLSSMGEESLLEWLVAHPEANVVLDAKWRSLGMMARLFELAPPSVRPQLIAQAYQLEQVEVLARVGFERVVLTLYRYEGTEQDLLEFLETPPDVLAAITLPADLAFGPLGRKVVATGIPTLTHPINSRWLAQRSIERGIGVYSSKLCGCAAEFRPRE